MIQYPTIGEQTHRINLGNHDLQFRTNERGDVFEVRTIDCGKTSAEYAYASAEYWEAVILFHEIIEDLEGWAPLTVEAIRACTIATTRLGTYTSGFILRKLIGFKASSNTFDSYNTYAQRVDTYFETGYIVD
jgi:hypothetical protein